jgi:hypothetical protein
MFSFFMKENSTMSDKMRWRYGDTNPVVAAVDSATVIEIGDFVYQDTDDAKPASQLRIGPEDRIPDQSTDIPGAVLNQSLQQLFADNFMGVALHQSRSGDMDPIRVATMGVFEFDCPSGTFELGDLVGVDEASSGIVLEDQQVVPVSDSRYAVARVARRAAVPVTGVLVDISSTIMTGGIKNR